MTGATVLKVGGSLIESGQALVLLRELVALRPQNLIIVPGGGAFADAVRHAQARHRFSESAAHHMALLTMHLSALMLADLQAGYALAEDEAQFHAAWRDGRMPIWLPERMVLADTAIPASWDITSDSLAAWLAHRIGAARLIVVKSAAAAVQTQDTAALVSAGIVDACFPDYVRAAPFACQVVTGVAGALSAIRPACALQSPRAPV